MCLLPVGDLLLVLHSHTDHRLALYRLHPSAKPSESRQAAENLYCSSDPELLDYLPYPKEFSTPQDYYLACTFANDSSAVLLHYLKHEEGLGLSGQKDLLYLVELCNNEACVVPLVQGLPGMPPFLLECALFSPDGRMLLTQMWSPACVGGKVTELFPDRTSCMHTYELYRRDDPAKSARQPPQLMVRNVLLARCDIRSLALPAFAPDSSLLAFCVGSLLSVYSPASIKAIAAQAFKNEACHSVQALVFNSAATQLAVCYGDARAMIIFSTKPWQPLETVDPGNLLYWGTFGMFTAQQGSLLVHTDSGQLDLLCELHSGAGCKAQIVVSPDDRFAAVGSGRGRYVQVLCMRSRKLLTKLTLPDLRLPADVAFGVLQGPSLQLAWDASGLALTVTRTWDTRFEARGLDVHAAAFAALLGGTGMVPPNALQRLSQDLQDPSYLPTRTSEVLQVVVFIFA